MVSASSVASEPEPVEPRREDARESDNESGDVEHVEAEVVDGHLDQSEPDSGRRVVTGASFSGPLPPPALLADYDEVMPGLAREIVDQWKSETDHRRATVDGLRQSDHDAMKAYYAGEKRGQIFGLILGLAVIALGVLAVILDSPGVAIAGILGAAGAIVWAVRRQPSLPEASGTSELDPGSTEDTPTETGDGRR